MEDPICIDKERFLNEPPLAFGQWRVLYAYFIALYLRIVATGKPTKLARISPKMAHTLQGLAFTIDLYMALCIFTDITLPQVLEFSQILSSTACLQGSVALLYYPVDNFCVK